jgi:hypothetical protein
MERQEASAAATGSDLVTWRSLLKGTGFGTAAASGLCLCDTTS